MKEQYELSTDILFISYFLKKNGWDGASKTSLQRVLYFSAELSTVFLKENKWNYSFSNTMFGPYNYEISNVIDELAAKELLELIERKISVDKVRERYIISEKGIKVCENVLFGIDNELDKRNWFELLVKILTVYGEKFLAKLVKEDPNVIYLDSINSRKKIPNGNSEDNLSKEFYLFLKKTGKEKFSIDNDSNEEFLLLFFDALYQKYKGGSKIG